MPRRPSRNRNIRVFNVVASGSSRALARGIDKHKRVIRRHSSPVTRWSCCAALTSEHRYRRFQLITRRAAGNTHPEDLTILGRRGEKKQVTMLASVVLKRRALAKTCQPSSLVTLWLEPLMVRRAEPNGDVREHGLGGSGCGMFIPGIDNAWNLPNARLDNLCGVACYASS